MDELNNIDLLKDNSNNFNIQDFYDIDEYMTSGIILITPNQTVKLLGRVDENHVDLLNRIYSSIYEDFESFPIEGHEESSVVSDNNILIELTRFQNFVYLPNHVNSSQIESLIEINNEFKDYLDAKNSDKALFVYKDENLKNLDKCIKILEKNIDDDIISSDILLSERKNSIKR